jgi:hypothetical protein
MRFAVADPPSVRTAGKAETAPDLQVLPVLEGMPDVRSVPGSAGSGIAEDVRTRVRDPLVLHLTDHQRPLSHPGLAPVRNLPSKRHHVPQYRPPLAAGRGKYLDAKTAAALPGRSGTYPSSVRRRRMASPRSMTPLIAAESAPATAIPRTCCGRFGTGHRPSTRSQLEDLAEPGPETLPLTCAPPAAAGTPPDPGARFHRRAQAPEPTSALIGLVTTARLRSPPPGQAAVRRGPSKCQRP